MIMQTEGDDMPDVRTHPRLAPLYLEIDNNLGGYIDASVALGSSRSSSLRRRSLPTAQATSTTTPSPSVCWARSNDLVLAVHPSTRPSHHCAVTRASSPTSPAKRHISRDMAGAFDSLVSAATLPCCCCISKCLTHLLTSSPVDALVLQCSDAF